MESKIVLRMKPLSTNKAWQGRRFKTKEYKAFEKESLIRLMQYKHIRYYSKIEVYFAFHIKNVAMSDVDNFLKQTIDSLVKSGIIKDDRNILRIVAEKFKSNEEFIEIIIKEFIT